MQATVAISWLLNMDLGFQLLRVKYSTTTDFIVKVLSIRVDYIIVFDAEIQD